MKRVVGIILPGCRVIRVVRWTRRRLRLDGMRELRTEEELEVAARTN
jgi:hypothetical protein